MKSKWNLGISNNKWLKLREHTITPNTKKGWSLLIEGKGSEYKETGK
jgi:hypothetical protein